MVKVTFCDRCNKEIKRMDIGKMDIFDDFFDKEDIFDDLSEAKVDGENTPKRIKKVQLCQNCLMGYNEIIDNTNKEIKEYLKKGKEKEVSKTENKKKKLGFFK